MDRSKFVDVLTLWLVALTFLVTLENTTGLNETLFSVPYYVSIAVVFFVPAYVIAELISFLQD